MIYFIEFCEDHGLDYVTEGHKHTRPGWIQVECPFCTGNPGYHLGYNTEQDFFACWRCGFKSRWEVLGEFSQLSGSALTYLHDHYLTGDDEHTSRRRSSKRHVSKVKYPYGTGELRKPHRLYLKKRGLDPEETAYTWKLLGTGHLGPYAYRIIAPIYMDGVLVSYQGRDITDRSELKYKACASKFEVRDHKECLYGYDQAKGGTVIICEGVVDVWKLGPGAVATFGVKTTWGQVRLLARFSKRIVLFDSDGAGQAAARQLSLSLAAFSGSTEIVKLKQIKDAGELSIRQARELKKELIGR